MLAAMEIGRLQVDAPRGERIASLALAHGAGAAMDSPFMDCIAQGLAQRRIGVVRFEFPYMQKRRASGKPRPPDRQAVLLECWKAVIERLGGGQDLFIGGKSMGGRMASIVADQEGVRGLVCLGYPFHPPGKPENLRTAHLEELRTPALIVQGERDAFGVREEVSGYRLSQSIEVVWMTEGDHSFKPRKRSGRTLEENLEEAVSAISDFIVKTIA